MSLSALILLGNVAGAAEIAPRIDQRSGPASTAPASAVAPQHILVKLGNGDAEQRFLAAGKALGLAKRGDIYGSSWITVSLPAGADPRAMARRAAALPGAVKASPDLVVTILDHFVPRDPMYLPPPTGYCDPLLELCIDQWGLFDANAEAAWHETLGDASVVVAVLDSGVDLDHDDLYANIWTNPGEIPGDGQDNDGNGIVDDVHGADFAGDNVGSFTDDVASQDGNPDIPEEGRWVNDPNTIWGIRWDGDPATGDAHDNDGDGYADLGVFHGTAVAGIVAAMTDNLVPGATDAYEGMAGGCPNCRIMAVRMINAEGSGHLSDAVAAVNYAADMGADFINASWGFDTTQFGPQDPEIAPLAEAIDSAIGQGVVIVAASGNGGTPVVHYPAADPRVIAVGSIDVNRNISFFSSSGPAGEIPDNGIDDDGNGWTDDVVDVVAPGEGIWSTWVFAAYDSLLYQLLGDPNWPPGIDTYSAADGTSFAAPLVTAYLALLKARLPDADRLQLREILRTNADDAIVTPGYDSTSGFGRLRMVVPADAPEIVNEPPLADIAGDADGMIVFQDSGKSGTEQVTLDGSVSVDPDGSVVGYQWDWTGSDGSSGSGTGPTITETLAVGTDLSYDFRLVVTDNLGAASPEAAVTVTIQPKSGGGGGGGKGGGNGSDKGGGPKKNR
ncbi:MAG: S8 family serine peptidase [Gammaproteobacteria bacterium]